MLITRKHSVSLSVLGLLTGLVFIQSCSSFLRGQKVEGLVRLLEQACLADTQSAGGYDIYYMDDLDPRRPWECSGIARTLVDDGQPVLETLTGQEREELSADEANERIGGLLEKARLIHGKFGVWTA